ncbi:MAG: polysaccharide deacetylase family protein [Clostridia bacterium]|nr:polysaccharide deacetylase family protein [Clostridia bacterium]
MCGYSVKKLPIYSVEREDKLIAISFDCAWGNEYTQKLLDEMQNYGIKATFFAVSFWVEKYPDEVKKIIQAGHELGTHSKTHSHMSKQTAKEINEELIYSSNAIKEITGEEVKLFRAPFGEYNNTLLECAESLGLYTIQWDVDSLDWKDLSAQEISMRVISRVKSGSIILCHNNGLHTAESLPLIFATLQSKGYKFVKISDLIYKDNYTMTHEGRQVKNTIN